MNDKLKDKYNNNKKKTFNVFPNADCVGQVKIGSGGAGNANFILSARAEALDSSRRGVRLPLSPPGGFH